MEQVGLVWKVIRKVRDHGTYDIFNITAIIDKDHVNLEILKRLKKFELHGKKKKEIKKSIARLGEKINNLYDYTIDVDIVLNRLWNLKRAKFYNSNVTAYFFKRFYPVIFDLGKNLLVVAPEAKGIK